METKTIYGQAYIMGDSLVQEQILITDNGKSSTGVVNVIDNIWDDLLSNTTTSKNNGKGWFYWEVTQTNLEGEDITIKFECPAPKDWTILENPNSPWARYWKDKYDATMARNCKIVEENYTLPGSQRLNFSNGNTEQTPDITYSRNGDLDNLLNVLYS